jgi:glycosyltransferase involved in cell wall biosynthesis
MRIAVVTSSPPLAEGGHTVIARALVTALRSAGHEAEVVLTPQNRFGRQAAAYAATWLTDVELSESSRIDQVISLRYPSYAVRHPRHVCWLNHTMREYYDLWPRFSAGLGRGGLVKERVRRRLTHAADRYLLTRNVRRLFVQSKTIQDRLRIWPELKSEVLYPPAPQRAYRCDEYGDYIFMVSRLTPLKRAELVLRALATPPALGVRAVIAGGGEEADRLRELVTRLGLESRVTLAGPLSEPLLLDHLARCRVVCFPPVQEDYGFVTIEAFSSGKPVITCTDSGGPAELVADGRRGFVCEPTPDALAQAFRRSMEDEGAVERMGVEALDFARSLTWDATVRTLTAVD